MPQPLGGPTPQCSRVFKRLGALHAPGPRVLAQHTMVPPPSLAGATQCRQLFKVVALLRGFRVELRLWPSGSSSHC